MRSGFVSILGRPNSGKSTLLNALVGEKVSIVTAKPQTTRNRINGILGIAARKGSGAHPAAQIVFVDTPGVHKPGTLMDKRMMQEVYDALESRDLVLLLVDATRRLDLSANVSGSDVARENPAAVERSGEATGVSPAKIPTEFIAGSSPARASEESDPLAPGENRIEGEDEFIFRLIRKLDCPVFLLINKIDLVEKEKLLPMIGQLSARYPFAEVIPVSARKKQGLDILLQKIIAHLPEGQRYFPKDQFTDQPERFMVAEIIREKILLETGEEVPYASAVVIEKFEEPPPAPKNQPEGAKPPVTRISAAIYCERSGQKAILIGKSGAKLKSIGASARREIESLLGTRVYLELFVAVREHWRESPAFLESLDWRKQLEDLSKK